MNDIIHVVIACDDYYFSYAYVCVKTLFENAGEDDSIVVHYIEQNVEDKHLVALNALGNDNNHRVEVIPFDMPTAFQDILPAYGPASKTTYIKFWFPSMFPCVDKVLYLDPDIIVMKSLKELYDTDLDNNLIAGVIENLPVYHKTASKMSKEDSYINGGMVLCNLKLWRECNLEGLALERLKDTKHNLNYDQGILNELCKGRILVLPPKYAVLAEEFAFRNSEKMKKRYGFIQFYSQDEIDEAINDPVMIHFTGFIYGKPMSIRCTHPYAEIFRQQLKDAPFDVHFSEEDIDIRKKIRKIFLNYLPFSWYLNLEKILDIRRKKIM